MTYVEGFLIPVPTAEKDRYLEMADAAADVFLRHGALEVVETWGDDMMRGKVTDFFKAVRAEEDETVVFSWAVWPTKEARDAGNAKAQQDPVFAEIVQSDVFNGKRMIYSGFQVLFQKKK